jgi:DNA ligase-1
MNLAELVGLVGRVRETGRKTEKVSRIAEALRGAGPEDAALAAMYLTGTLPQGRIGVGWRMVQAALGAASGRPGEGAPWTLDAMDRLFTEIAALEGAGSGEKRAAALGRLWHVRP